MVYIANQCRKREKIGVNLKMENILYGNKFNQEYTIYKYFINKLLRNYFFYQSTKLKSIVTREELFLNFGHVQVKTSVPEVIDGMIQMGQGIANAVILIGVGLKGAIRL